MMCHKLIKFVKNFLFCTSLCKALAWMLLPKFTLGPIWALAHGWRVFQFFTSAKWSIVVFTWNIYSNPCDLFNLYHFEFLATPSPLHVAMQKTLSIKQSLPQGRTQNFFWGENFLILSNPTPSVQLGIKIPFLPKRVGFSRPKTMATKISQKV